MQDVAHAFLLFGEAGLGGGDELLDGALLPGGDVGARVEHGTVFFPLGGVSVDGPALAQLADLHPVQQVLPGRVGSDVARGLVWPQGQGRLFDVVQVCGERGHDEVYLKGMMLTEKVEGLVICQGWRYLCS